MKYCTAIVLIGRLNNFKADLKEIDIEKAKKYNVVGPLR